MIRKRSAYKTYTKEFKVEAVEDIVETVGKQVPMIRTRVATGGIV